MQLLLEYTESNNIITEDTNGNKNYFIEGIFMQAEQVNRNKRVYPHQIMEGEVNRYVSEFVSKNRAMGELNHPMPPNPSLDLKNVSHVITELHMEGNNVLGKAKLLSTPSGLIAQALINDGITFGVSSRALGTTTRKGGVGVVNEDFHLACIDIVADPSAPDAFVSGLMEGKEWVWENGVCIQKDLEEIVEKVESGTRETRKQINIDAFYNFLSKL